MSHSIGWGVTVAVSWMSIGTISWVSVGTISVPVWILLVGILVGSLVVLIVPGTTVAVSVWVSVMSTISWVSVGTIAVGSVPVVGLLLVLGGLGLGVVVPVALWVMDG